MSAAPPDAHAGRFRRVLLLLALIAAGVKGDLVADVVVESVAPHSVAARVGILPGDVLASWRRGTAQAPAASGSFESPFDLLQFAIEQSQRPGVSVRVMRGGRPLRFRLYPGRVGLDVGPGLEGADLGDYLAGKRFADSDMMQRAYGAWGDLVSRLESRQELTVSCWLSLRIADSQSKFGLPAASATFERTDTLCRSLPPLVRALVAEIHAAHFQRNDGFEQAERLYRFALTTRQAHAARSLGVASSLHDLGLLAFNRGNGAQARSLFEQAVSLRRALARGSLDLASSLGQLAIVTDDSAKAERLYREALAILEQVAPVDPNAAATYNNFAIFVLNNKKDLSRGEHLLQKSLAVDQQLGNPKHPMTVMNLGLIAMDRGNLAEAESLLLDVLLRQQMYQDGLATAGVLQNLGNLAELQGDLGAAESYHQRALRIRVERHAGSRSHGMSLLALGNLARRRRDFGRAESLYQQALETLRRADGDIADVREALQGFAELALDRGNLDTALDFARRAAEAHTAGGASRPPSGDVYATLARVHRARGDLAEAERAYRAALAARAPGAGHTWREAEWLHALGVLAEEQGRRSDAVELLRRAVVALESQRRRVGSDQARATFSRESAAVHADYLDILVESGQSEAAFHVLERSRANAFLERLAERDLLFSADLPERLREYRTSVEADFDRVQEQLGALDPQRDKVEVARKRERLTELTARLAEIQQRVKARAPRLAQVQYPEPLTFKAARPLLRRGTVLLAYSVGQRRTRLFVASPPGAGAQPELRVVTIPLGRDVLAARVDAFRRSLARRTDGTAVRADVLESGGGLYDLLLRPVEDAIGGARRLLLVPDASLHALPFGALVRRSPGQAPRFLIESVAVMTVPSMTVYAELARRPRAAAGSMLAAAFGDPKYPPSAATPAKRMRSDPADEAAEGREVSAGAAESGAEPVTQALDESVDPELSAVLRSGTALVPLPGSRDEAAAIADLYAPRSAVFVGDAATERQARSIPPGTRIVHFAVHGIVNERFPLNSGLALTVPAKRAETQENGLLQAWEIINHVRLDADLVTLSTCQSAIGSVAGGEGLLTLARAFQYAGARTVLASLWRVEDRATARLMTSFYRSLRSGSTIVDSLRAAQLALLRTSEHRHPFYWAAFTISGYGE
jgi:CHAT domain-containing protein/tetratricopeptide (TPR) repeat protein